MIVHLSVVISASNNIFGSIATMAVVLLDKILKDSYIISALIGSSVDNLGIENRSIMMGVVIVG